jgi:hypothetical protein
MNCSTLSRFKVAGLLTIGIIVGTGIVSFVVNDAYTLNMIKFIKRESRENARAIYDIPDCSERNAHGVLECVATKLFRIPNTKYITEDTKNYHYNHKLSLYRDSVDYWRIMESHKDTVLRPSQQKLTATSRLNSYQHGRFQYDYREMLERDYKFGVPNRDIIAWQIKVDSIAIDHLLTAVSNHYSKGSSYNATRDSSHINAKALGSYTSPYVRHLSAMGNELLPAVASGKEWHGFRAADILPAVRRGKTKELYGRILNVKSAHRYTREFYLDYLLIPNYYPEALEVFKGGNFWISDPISPDKRHRYLGRRNSNVLAEYGA